MDIEHKVYVLYSNEEDAFYVGYTADLDRRMREHQAGQTYSTSRRQGLKLIFYEAYLSKQDALRRELYLKTSKGKKALKLMLRETLAGE